jgi:taurine dioxygenase
MVTEIETRAPGPAPRLQIAPLSPAIGITVTGVDVRRLTDAEFKRIEEAWVQNCIALFPGQSLSQEEQVEFAARFGPLGQLINKHEGRRDHPAVMYVSNVREDGKLIGVLPDGEMWFHSDQCYSERPCAATMLYAMEIPSQGGNTLYANMYRAYAALSEPMKRRIAGFKALNVYDYNANPTKAGPMLRPDAPHYAHPVVRTHPVTKRKCLYVNRLMTVAIEDIPREESDRLLAELFDHQERPEFIYEHRWTPGDLLVWDNRCTLHARTDFDASERRMLRRVIVLGDKPY